MLNRRRFLAISASSMLPAAQARTLARTPEPMVWRGVVLGALSSMQLVHPDRAHARFLLSQCLDEIERLEAIFSLYRPDSALSRLNAAGTLPTPPAELAELLSASLALARASGGAFDPTIQPLFRLYLDHFKQLGADARGPARRQLARALSLVGFEAVELNARRIRLPRQGMALTLNGIAQGFITDRIAARLRAGGLRHVLVNLGEARAAGHAASGQPWSAAIVDPADPSRRLFGLTLGERDGQCPALATSGGYGMRFGRDPRVHHLLDPRSGRSANHHASVSVAAGNATLADGLSTALSILPAESGARLLLYYPGVRAWFVDGQGRVSVHDSRSG